ncbi:hypothetical protein Drorol1_Dr00011086, partial [Drosera rotundifolia]
MGGGEFPPEDNHAATGDVGNLDRPRRRKPSQWDEPPPSMLPGGGGGAIILSDLVRGAIRGLAETFPVMHPFGEAQATRNARCVYVGSLSPTTTEQSVAIFFNHAMEAIGGNIAGRGTKASTAMALDGIIFEGTSVMGRRPSDYNPLLVAVLGSSQSNPNLNLAVVGLGTWSARPEGRDCIFVGGLSYYFTEAQVRGLVNIVIPQPGLVSEVVPGVVKVFLEFADPESGLRAKEALARSGRQVLAFCFPEDKFAREEVS